MSECHICGEPFEAHDDAGRCPGTNDFGMPPKPPMGVREKVTGDGRVPPHQQDVWMGLIVGLIGTATLLLLLGVFFILL